MARKDERRERLGVRLRENLARRKTQQRAAPAPPPDDPPGDAGAGDPGKVAATAP